MVDAKLIFTAALKANACNIILSHNHPSGNLKPSKADEELTKKMATAGIYLDINVTDHLMRPAKDIILLVTCGTCSNTVLKKTVCRFMYINQVDYKAD